MKMIICKARKSEQQRNKKKKMEILEAKIKIR